MVTNANSTDLRQLKQVLETRATSMISGQAIAFSNFTLFRKGNRVGVAVPTGDSLVNIHNVRPGQSYLLEGDAALPLATGNFLTLTVSVDEVDLSDSVKADDFSSRMLAFVSQDIRAELIADPWAWAAKVIEMSGDKTTKTRPYPYVAELYLASRLHSAGLLADLGTEYCGPGANRHDFELETMSIECKSHLHADRGETAGELVVSSATQLSRTAGKPLYVVYFSMEETGSLSLESCVGEFPDDRVTVLGKLAENGFAEGDFSWQRPYNLTCEPRVYEITDAFPRITPEQFANGVFPSGVTKLVYHVSLANLPYCTLSNFIRAKQGGDEPVFEVARG